MYSLEQVKAVDPEIAQAIVAEQNRQNSHLELIASENWVSKAVMAAMGSPLTNKYAEGYPAKRFLYYLRGVLACKWIEDNKSLPPVPFKQLVDAIIKDKTMVDKIDELIQLKKKEKECDMMIVDNSLVEYARSMGDYYNDRVNTFRPEQDRKTDEMLDSILYDMVMNH